jgi:hypothetical protein
LLATAKDACAFGNACSVRPSAKSNQTIAGKSLLYIADQMLHIAAAFSLPAHTASAKRRMLAWPRSCAQIFQPYEGLPRHEIGIGYGSYKQENMHILIATA